MAVFRGRAYHVRPPTAREAILTYQALYHLASGDPSAGGVFREVVAAWLPPRLSSMVLARGVPLQAAASFAYELLGEGLQASPRAQQGGEPGGAGEEGPQGRGEDALGGLHKMATADWDQQAMDFGAVFRMPLAEVYALPWGFFLAASARMKEAAAREAIRAGRAASVPHMTEESLEKLGREARAREGQGGGGAESRSSQARAVEVEPTDWERVKRDRERLKKLFRGGSPSQ
ncbi:MAG: hypothetical protein R3247_14715 [Rhodothermales bacterium]|nr:hypothetical protein [Rhodothermales bacterium]